MSSGAWRMRREGQERGWQGSIPTVACAVGHVQGKLCVGPCRVAWGPCLVQPAPGTGQGGHRARALLYEIVPAAELGPGGGVESSNQEMLCSFFSFLLK